MISWDANWYVLFLFLFLICHLCNIFGGLMFFRELFSPSFVLFFGLLVDFNQRLHNVIYLKVVYVAGFLALRC